MPYPTNTYSRYAVVGNREDLENTIYNVSPFETPVMNAIGRTDVTNTLHEWQTDTIRAPRTNAQIEGDTFTNVARVPTTRLSNWTQIFTDTIGVTGTQLAMKPAGRADEMTYQLSLAMKALKTDVETAILANVGGGNGTENSTGRTMRGLPSWLASNVSAAANGANGASGSARTDGDQRALTEDLLKNVLRSVYDNSGEVPSMIVAGSFNRSVISSTFTGGNNRMQSMEKAKLDTTIKIYEGDFGVYQIVPDRFVRTRDLFVLNPDYLSLGYLRTWRVEDLAKTSDTDQKAIIAECTLIVRNERAHGAVFDLTTSA
ncbi:phage head protein [bacterium]|nr:phage head protein [bacterium]